MSEPKDRAYKLGQAVLATGKPLNPELLPHLMRDNAALRARLATAEGFLLGLTVDDAMWPNHKDCICGDCELLREIRAFLAQTQGEPHD